ncbi:uncharacterized protein EV420DRAFT_1486910 [Desarmillaria tabescens]|uniref:Uncharacterized protein n=1 Tax=Armillaria tabescens TaxID=1929756 RepID=A0AA39J8N5_ARMTA|nr:uncharacterized protein EV420DRAFT_1486910 [Desarmillaria tabescens]KAK0437744.1 hypothetical protein EV420DRAFT_1486910 [Desarmillaria tabescens]
MSKKRLKNSKATVSSTSSVTSTIPATSSSQLVPLRKQRGWTNDDQYDMLSNRIPRFELCATNGTLAAFKAELVGEWQDWWPERKGKFFLDRKGRVRKVSGHLIGITDSPKDESFPKMVGDILTLGPDHCLDSCDFADPKDEEDDGNGEESLWEPDPEVEEVHIALGVALEERRTKLFNWYGNNKPGHHIRKLGGLSTFALSTTRVPQPIHKYSNMYYTERILPRVITEAESHGVPCNELLLVKEMTAHAWANESEEIKKLVMNAIEKDKELIAAMKDSTLDINVSDADKIIIIESLQYELASIFEHINKFIGWGFVVIAGGYDPWSGRVRTTGHNFCCKGTNGKDFIKSFNENAAAGYTPGTILGDRHSFSEYYSVPFMHHMKKLNRLEGETVASGKTTKETQVIVQAPLSFDPVALFEEPLSSVLPEQLSLLSEAEQPLPDQSSAPLPVPKQPVPASPPDQNCAPLLVQINNDLSQLPPCQESASLSANAPLFSKEQSLPLPPVQNSSPPPSGLLSQPFPQIPTLSMSISIPTASFARQDIADSLLLSDCPLDDVFGTLDQSSTQPNLLLSRMYPFSNNLPSSSDSLSSSQMFDFSEPFDDLAFDGLDWSAMDWTTLFGSELDASGVISSNPASLPMLPSPSIDRVIPTLNAVPLPMLPSPSIDEVIPTLNAVPPPSSFSVNVSSSMDDLVTMATVSGTADLSNISFSSVPKHVVTKTVVPSKMTSTTSSISMSTSIPDPLPDVSNLSRPSRQHKRPGPKEVMTLSVTEKVHGPPRWIAEARLQMEDESLGPAWADLLDKWRQLECDIWSSDVDPVGKLMVLRRRPHPLTLWLDGARYFDLPPVVKDYSQFASEMIDWWNQLNPSWRRSLTGGLPRPDYTSKSLLALRKGERKQGQKHPSDDVQEGNAKHAKLLFYMIDYW